MILSLYWWIEVTFTYSIVVCVFATRLSPDTAVSDVCVHLLQIQLRKSVTRFQSYSSFWLSCVVEADVYDNTSTLRLSEEAWPAGVLLRKYNPKRSG